MGGASRAVMSKIMSHEGAAAAMATTMEQMPGPAGGPTTPRSARRRRSRTASDQRDG